MKISCPKCPAVYELDESRIPAAGLSIKCPKCKSSFTVHRPKPGEEGKLVEGRPTAVPLPAWTSKTIPPVRLEASHPAWKGRNESPP